MTTNAILPIPTPATLPKRPTLSVTRAATSVVEVHADLVHADGYVGWALRTFGPLDPLVPRADGSGGGTRSGFQRGTKHEARKSIVAILRAAPAGVEIELFSRDRYLISEASTLGSVRAFPEDAAGARPGYGQTISAAQAALAAGLASAPRLTVAVDGSFGRGSRGGGWAFLAADGSYSTGSSDHACSSHEAELRAILLALSTLPANRRLTVQSDSRIALSWIKEPTKAASKVRHLAFAVQVLAANRHVRFVWVKGHAGAGLHDGADRLAVAARRGREAGLRAGDWGVMGDRIAAEAVDAHVAGEQRRSMTLAA